jgi:hypothetical protein
MTTTNTPDPRDAELSALRERAEKAEHWRTVWENTANAYMAAIKSALATLSDSGTDIQAAASRVAGELAAAQTAARQASEAMRPLVIRLRELLGGILKTKLPDDATDTTRKLLLAGIRAQARFCDHIAADLQRLSLPASAPAETPETHPVTIDYTNWKGERSVRTIIPHKMFYAASPWHTNHQWLLTAFDCDKHEHRTFALSGIHAWGVVAPSSPPPEALDAPPVARCECGHAEGEHFDPRFRNAMCVVCPCVAFRPAPPVAPSSPTEASDKCPKCGAVNGIYVCQRPKHHPGSHCCTHIGWEHYWDPTEASGDAERRVVKAAREFRGAIRRNVTLGELCRFCEDICKAVDALSQAETPPATEQTAKTTGE